MANPVIRIACAGIGVISAVITLAVGSNPNFVGGPDTEVLISGLGMAAGLVARSPRRLWWLFVPLVALISLASQTIGGADTTSSLIVGSTSALAVVVGAAILTWQGRRAALATTQDLAYLAFAAVAVGVIGGTGQLAAAVGHHDIAVTQATQTFILHASVTLIAGGLVLSIDFANLRVAEPPLVLSHTSILAVISMIVFLPAGEAPPSFLALPVLILGALRFEVWVVVTQVAAFSLYVRLCTSIGRGPFSDSAGRGYGPHEAEIFCLAYIICAALVVFPLVLTVTQRRLLLERTAADEEMFRRTFTDSPLGMLMLDEDGGRLTIRDANRQASLILGAPRAALARRNLEDILTTQVPLSVAVRPLVRGDVNTWRADAVALSRPASSLHVAIAALDLEGHDTRAYSAQMIDTTQEQDTLRRLTAAQQLTDATLDTAACIIVVTDPSGTIVRVNAATQDITGYDESVLVGAPLWEAPFSPLQRAEAEAMFEGPNRSGFDVAREVEATSADGDALLIAWNYSIVPDSLGVSGYAVLTGIDVTHERSAHGLVNHLMQGTTATALIGIDNAGVITMFNAGAEHMMGYSSSDVIGAPFISLLDADELHARVGATGAHEAFTCLIGTIGEHEESRPSDWTWVTRAGQEVAVSMTLSATNDLIGGTVGFLCVARDVTEQRDGHETLRKALEKEHAVVERLRRLDHAKDEFVTTVSHELRTPITSILGYTEMLLEDSKSHDEREQVLTVIDRNARRLMAICNDLLLLGGFDNGPAFPQQQPLDLRDSVTALKHSGLALLNGRDVELTFNVSSHPLRVLGDRSQLDRVVVNLVHNAIKFTPDGGRVEVQADEVDGHAVLTVTDTGIGIPEPERTMVFERFYRAEEARRRAIAGTGLGLSIVASIIDSHGGEIDVESTPGRGSMFRVRIPLTSSDGVRPSR